MSDFNKITEQHILFMQEALKLAKQGAKANEVPVGAVVVLNGDIIGRGYNCPISQCDPSAHAEIQALRDAAKKIGNYRLVNCDLYVTVEPCTMCAGAILQSRIRHLLYGTCEPKAGAVRSKATLFDEPYFNHKVQVTGGILQKESCLLMQRFFQQKRAEKKST